MKYKGIVFDLDGVICSTDKYHYEAWKKTAKTLGCTFNHKLNDKLRGVSRSESLDIILKANNKELTETEKALVLANKNKLYQESLADLNASAMEPDVLPTLFSLKRLGIKLAIGSSSKNAQLIIQKLGIQSIFDTICDGTMIKKSKPAPDIFLLAAQKLSLSPSVCLVIEDSTAGIDAAYDGGFDSAGMGAARLYLKATYILNQKELLLRTMFRSTVKSLYSCQKSLFV